MATKIGALAVAMVFGMAVASGVSAAGSRISAPTEIDTIETHKVQHVIENNGREGLGVGDMLTVSENLSSLDGSAILAHSHEVCTVIHPGKKLSLLCSSTVEFPDGQISVAGEFPPTDPQTSYAVTGGTGVYENVGGTMTITTGPDPGVLELDFLLVP